MKKTTETKPSRSEPKGEWIDSCDGEASAVRALRNSGLKPWRLHAASPPSAPLSADFTPLKPAGPRGATCSPRFNSFLSCWGPLEPPGRRAPPEPVPGAESGHRVGQPDLRHVTNPAAAWTPREHHLASESARPGEPSPRPSKGRRGRSNPPGGLRFPRSSSPVILPARSHLPSRLLYRPPFTAPPCVYRVVGPMPVPELMRTEGVRTSGLLASSSP